MEERLGERDRQFRGNGNVEDGIVDKVEDAERREKRGLIVKE